MRIVSVVLALLCFAFLSGCGTSSEVVTASLKSQFEGQSVDALVMRFGPPARSFQLSDGGAAYEWDRGDIRVASGSEYQVASKAMQCRIKAVAGPDKIVRSVTTSDVTNILGESKCGLTAS